MQPYENIWTKEEIIDSWIKSTEVFRDYFQNISAENLVLNKNGKWSIAENLEHLIISNVPIIKALSLPKMALKNFGIPSEPSRKPIEILNAYKKILAAGATATKQFIPQNGKEKSRVTLLAEWQKVGEKLSEKIEKFQDSELDEYVLPHPILGNFTLREMLFFTIIHNYHHLKNVKKLNLE